MLCWRDIILIMSFVKGSERLEGNEYVISKLEIGAIGKRVFKETGTWKFYIWFQHLFLIIQAVSYTNKFAHYINSRNSKTETQENRDIIKENSHLKLTG